MDPYTAAQDWLPLLSLIALVAGLPLLYRSFTSLRFALYLLVFVVCFGGIVAVNLGNSGYAVVFRDVFVVLPLYLGFFFSRSGQEATRRIPAELLFSLAFLVAVIGIDLVNPDVGSAEQVAIGLKVWLFYIPFLVVGVAVANRPGAMLSLLRTMLIFGGAACAVGLMQSLLVRVVGYETTMGWFFGSHADNVTQNFTFFDEAGGIYRIPGTFSFVAQYGQFLVLYLTVGVILANADPSPRLRRIALWMSVLAVLAALLSGARTTVVAIPAMLVIYAFCGLMSLRLALFLPVAIAAGAAVIAYSGLELLKYFYIGVGLAQEYGSDFIFQQIFGGLTHGFFGYGIGSSTSAARFAMSEIQAENFIGYESWFGKSAAELGWLGFIAVCVIVLTILVRSGVIFLRNRGRPENAVVAPLATYIGYMIVLSFKGSVLDFDPGNIFFWLLLGMMIGVDQVKNAFEAGPAPIRPAGVRVAGYTRTEQEGD